jgi:hypothetical protein
VCIIINNTVKAIPISLPSKYSHLELCILDILLSEVKLRLFVGYRSPSSNSDPTALQYVKDPMRLY